MRVAFLGLGTMGAPMAANILRKGHSLVVWNRTIDRDQDLVAAGALRASTPADAARNAEIVITMLADPAAVEMVVCGKDGVIAGLEPHSIVVDMSTVDAMTARRVDEHVRAHGGSFLDAPVSGTRKPAEDGTLVIMAGGDPSTLERARPVLECMGRVVPVGGVGQGMAMKLVLNGLGAHMMTGFAAMLTFGRTQGLAARDMLAVIGAGAFSSPLYASKGPKMVARDFRPDFKLELMRKDQRLVLDAAAAAGYPLPTLQAVLEVLDEAVDAGFGPLDLSGVVRLFETWAQVTVDDSPPK
jgi:3-hydroxyisobutyrate dehydrogenase-like beta-hydroxyacid dehydrogenase